ncbi:Uncharacterised protein [Mycobacteroides abscessus subsp. abscessus]|nr:Uncharacterised protein [Mycobacteroides abscessus subsp. abscessus]
MASVAPRTKMMFSSASAPRNLRAAPRASSYASAVTSKARASSWVGAAAGAPPRK